MSTQNGQFGAKRVDGGVRGARKEAKRVQNRGERGEKGQQRGQ